MSALSIQPVFPIFTDISGHSLDAGYIWIGAANLDPQTNPINVYWDAALTLPAAQPIRTLAGYPSNSGTPARLYVNSDYSIQVQNKNGSVVYSAPAATERYSDVVTAMNAQDVVYDPPFVSAVATNVETKLSEVVSVLDFGAVGDGVTDDTLAIQAAIDHVAIGGGTVLFPAGKTYIVTTSLSALQKNSVCLVGQGNATAGAGAGSILKFTAASGSRLIDARSSAGFMLSGMYVWQSNAAYSGAVVDLGHGPAAYDSGYAIVEKNIFVLSGASRAVDVTKAIIFTARDNYFNGGARAIYCDTGAGNYANVINVQNNTFYQQSSAPLYNGGSASANWNVNNNTFEPLSSGNAGGLWTKGIVGLTFTGNYCGDANNVGYWVVLDGGVSGAQIFGNLFAVGGFGVYMQGATANQAIVITSNVFSDIDTADIFIDAAHTAYADIHNNFHYLSTQPIAGTLSGGRFQTSSAGTNFWRGTVQFSTAAANGVGAVESGVMWKITSGGGVSFPLVVKAGAAQASPLTEWRDSSEAVVASIRPAGGMAVNAPEPNFYAGSFVNSSATNPYGVLAKYAGVSGGTGQPFFLGKDDQIRFQVLGNGNVQNVSGSYGAISDIKHKQDVADCTPKLADLLSVRVVNYRLKDSPQQKHLGVIAQELEQVFPGMVEEMQDTEIVTRTREVEVPETQAEDGTIIPAHTKTVEYQEIVNLETTTKSVKYSVFVPMLIKAVQELKAEIDAIKGASNA